MQQFKYNPNYNTGQFRHRITFQIYDKNAKDQDGFPLTEEQRWKYYKKVWAKIKTVKGSEYHQAATTKNENTIRFIIRFTKDINPDMRIIYREHAYEIESVINDDMKSKTLTIIAKEVV
ncbi:phage head closure protein [Cytobacillus sp. Hm23]